MDQEESDYNGDEDSMVINVNEESEKETGKPYTSKDSPMDGNSRWWSAQGHQWQTSQNEVEITRIMTRETLQVWRMVENENMLILTEYL